MCDGDVYTIAATPARSRAWHAASKAMTFAVVVTFDAVISMTLALWRSDPRSVGVLPKRASLSQGSAAFSVAVVVEMSRRVRGGRAFLRRFVVAAWSWKKVTTDRASRR